MLAAYRALIAQGVSEGAFRPIDPALLYYSLAGACDHLFHAGYSVPSTLGVSSITDEVRPRYIAHVAGAYLDGMLHPKQ